MSIKLANGQNSNPFNLNTYNTEVPIVLPSNERLPIILFKKIDSVNIVIDKTHPLFGLRGKSTVEVISSEVASYIFDLNRTLVSYPSHSVSNIAWQIIRTYWFDKVEISEDSISKKCKNLLTSIKEQIANVIDASLSERFFNEMSEAQQTFFANEILKNKIPLSNIGELKATGEFVRYVTDDYILHMPVQMQHHTDTLSSHFQRDIHLYVLMSFSSLQYTCSNLL